MNKIAIFLVFTAAVLLQACGKEVETTQYEQGVHYQSYTSVNKAEQVNTVTEFFWYGCRHCKAFAPVLSQWQAQQPAVVNEYIPIIWGEKTELHARLYFLLAEQENFKALHEAMFTTVGDFSKTSSVGEQKVALIRLLNTLGISPMDSADALDGDQYDEQLAQVLLKMQQFEISGVPTILVNGQHKVINKSLSSIEEALAVAGSLLQR